MLAYVLFGETNIGRRRIARFKRAMERLPAFADDRQPRGRGRRGRRAARPHAALPRRPVDLAASRWSAATAASSSATPTTSSTHMVADIDAAERHVHVCFYIWLADSNGLKVVEALKRAAAPRRHLPRDGRRPRLARHDPLRALAGHGRGRRPARRGAADRLPAVAPAQGPDRHAQPPQDRGDRQPHHLLRLEQLRRRRLRDQAEVRPLGRRDDALRGPDRAAEPARLRHRLDGPRQGGPLRRSSRSRSRSARASRRR